MDKELEEEQILTKKNDLRARVKDINVVKKRHSKRLRDKHGFRGIGVGYKMVNGEKTDRLSVVFFVEKKLSKEEIPVDQRLPKTLDGVECDVVEMDEIFPLASSVYSSKIRPATPGYSVGHYQVTAGTLGCVCYKGTNRYILSNNHVLANQNQASIGDAIYQPGVYDGGTSADTIAYLSEFVTLANGVNVDCAIASITNQSLVSNVGVWGGEITSYEDPVIGDIVYKSGRTTGDTSAAIIYEHVDVSVTYGGQLGLLTINDCFMTSVQSAGGDSGSVGRKNNTTAVGLLFAGSTSTSVFVYMSHVVDAMGISFIQPEVRYWVGGTDNWDATAGSKWSETDGGTGGASIPSNISNVFITSGSITISNDITIGSLKHTGGALNTNNKNVNVSSFFETSGSSSRSLTLGSSIISVGNFTYSGSGLVLSEGTSTIIVTGNGQQDFNGNGETYYNVQLNGRFHNLTGQNTFTNLYRSNSTYGKASLVLSNNQTITGLFQIYSNNISNMIYVSSNIVGTRRTITSSTFSINYASFRDIALSGGGVPITPTASQNLGNNNGITFPSANRYWVGGSGNWSDGGNHWSLTSGGTPGQTPPGITDNIYFNSSSSSIGYNINVDIDCYANDLIFSSPPSGVITLGGIYSLYIYGGLSLCSGMDLSTFYGNLFFRSTSNKTISFLNNSLSSSDLFFEGVSGYWTLQDDLDIGTGNINLTNGTLNTNNFNVTCGSFYSYNTSSRTLILGSSTVTLTDIFSYWAFNSDPSDITTGLTFNAGTSTIRVATSGNDGGTTPSSINFFGGGKTFYNLEVDRDAFIFGTNTFNNLTKTNSSNELKDVFLTYSNLTVNGTLTLSGHSTQNRLWLVPYTLYTNGGIQTVSISASNVVASYVDIYGITALGTANWDLSSIPGGSGDCSSNTNITFTSPVDQHWLNPNGGYWSDIANWTSRVPLPQDNVFLDCAFGTNKTVAVNMSRYGNDIDWTGATWTSSLTWDGYDSSYAYIFGSLKIPPGLSFSGTLSTIEFRGSRDGVLIINEPSLPTVIINIAKRTGTLSLGNNITFNGSSIQIYNGILSAGNYSINTSKVSGYSTESILKLGSATHNIQSLSIVSSGGIQTETSTLRYANTSNSNITIGLPNFSMTYHNILLDRGSSTGNITFINSNSFNEIRDNGTESHSLIFTHGTTQTVGSFVVNGSSGKEVVLNSDTTGTFSLVKSGSNIVSCDYLNIQHSIATPSNIWYAGGNSTNNQGVASSGSGWIFSPAPSNSPSVSPSSSTSPSNSPSFSPSPSLSPSSSKSPSNSPSKSPSSSLSPSSSYSPSSSVSPSPSLGDVGIIDYYPTSNYNAVSTYYYGSNTYGGQSFSCNGKYELDSCKFYIRKYGLPAGNVYAQLYAHSGIYGSFSKPTGSPLAISGPLDISTLTETLTLKTFTFSGADRIQLTAGNKYVIVLNYSGTQSLAIGEDQTQSHSGNKCYSVDGTTWTSTSTADIIFYVYGVIESTISESSSSSPSKSPSISPSLSPSSSHSPSSSKSPSISPSLSSSVSPSLSPSSSRSPSSSPSSSPSNSPSVSPSLFYSSSLSPSSSVSPSISPSRSPSSSVSPSKSPSTSPSLSPSASPSLSPSISPSLSPSSSISPSKSPSISPSVSPSLSPSSSISPSTSPSNSPSKSPSMSPSISPSTSPSNSASKSPSASPSLSPSSSRSPSISPSLSPSSSKSPSNSPSISPSSSVSPSSIFTNNYQGPLSPTNTNNNTSIGTLEWLNTDNVKISDNNYSTVSFNNTDGTTLTSNYLVSSNFGFSIPTEAIINGIKIEIEANISSDYWVLDYIRIIKNDIIGSNNKTSPTISISDSYVSIGGEYDLWGETWTASDINNTSFGVAVATFLDSIGYYTVSIDNIRITVYYSELGSPSVSPSSSLSPSTSPSLSPSSSTSPSASSPVSFYWIGGSGSTSDWESHWSYESGGSPTVSNAPTQYDNVFIDSSSGLSGGSITFDSPIECNNFTSETGHNYSFDGSSYIYSYGSVVLESGIDNIGSVNLSFNSLEVGNIINTNGVVFSNCAFVGAGGWTLYNDFSCSGPIYFGGGTFDANDHNVTSQVYFFSDAEEIGPVVIVMRSGTWEATGNDDYDGYAWGVAQYIPEYGVTFYPNTSTIKFTDSSSSSKTLYFHNSANSEAGKTYNKLLLTGSGSGTYYIEGSNIFNEIKDNGSEAHSIMFRAGETQTVSSWVVSGSVGKLISLDTLQIGTILVGEIDSPGYGYSINDILDISSSGGQIQVDSIFSESLNGNLITNGSFSGNADNWSLSYGCDYNDYNITYSNVSSAVQNGLSISTGVYYKLEFDVTGSNNGNMQLILGGDRIYNFLPVSDGHFVVYGASGSGSFGAVDSLGLIAVGFTGSITNITLKEVSSRGGGINSFTLLNGGSGYSASTGYSLSGGTGNDAIFYVSSIVDGAQSYLYKTSGVVLSNYLNISNSNAGGGAVWNAGLNSIDTTNNDGWIFGEIISPSSSVSPSSSYSPSSSKSPSLSPSNSPSKSPSLSPSSSKSPSNSPSKSPSNSPSKSPSSSISPSLSPSSSVSPSVSPSMEQPIEFVFYNDGFIMGDASGMELISDIDTDRIS